MRRRRLPPRRAGRPRRRLGRAAALVALALTGAGALAQARDPNPLAFLPIFLVERVDVSGLAYLERPDVLRLAGFDSTTSVWVRRAPALERVEAHPIVRSATLVRRPPSALHLALEEVTPVGLVARGLVSAVGPRGDVLPVDPTDPVLDLPVLEVASERARALWGLRLLAREMDALRERAPEVFAVVSEARLGDGSVDLVLGDAGLVVRYAPPASARRLREAMVAVRDAAERFPERSPSEIDLRFADQVVVRTGVPTGDGRGAGGA